MVLSLVVIDKIKTLNNQYCENYQGFFVTKEGALCYKPVKESNCCYMVNTGEQFDYKDEPVYSAYFEDDTRSAQVAEEEKKGIFEDWKRKSHPSYGMLSFSRTSCTPATALFGSSIKHGNPIRMVLSHANVERGLNKDWFHARGRIAEIEMSQSQFADAITSLNMGDGVPCTITFTERDGYISACDFTSKTEQFQGEFSDQLSGVRDSLDENIKVVEEMFKTRKTFRTEDKKKIMQALYKARQDVGANADYALNSFSEQMDKTVQEAKGEIESFMQHQSQKYSTNTIFNNKQNSEEMLINNINNPIELE